MMGKTRSFHEAKATLNGVILVGNISFGTTYSSGCLGWSNANICNEIEKGQMEEYKKKERQKEVFQDWAFSWSIANLCNKIVLKQIEVYKKKKRQRVVCQGLAFSRSNANLCDDIVEEQIEEYKKKERQREGWAFSWSNANLCNDIEEGQMEEYKKKERQREAKETPIANRELMEEITNDERNDMEEEQMEEIEIKEGHDDVEEEQDNKITMPIFNFCGNLLNEERGQVEGNKIEEGQEEVQEEQDNEPWIFPPREIGISISRAKQDRYLRRRFCWDCQRDHLRLSTMLKLIDIEIKPTEITEEQLGRQLFISEEQLGRQLFWDPFEEKMGIRSILFQGGQSRRKLFERTIKTTLIEMMGKWKQREGNAVVEDDAIMEREKQTDVTEKLSGEFDDEEKEKRELEQLLRCKVCLDSDACVVLFPCRHMATCEYCEGFLQCCPVCRSFIDEAVKVNEEN